MKTQRKTNGKGVTIFSLSLYIFSFFITEVILFIQFLLQGSRICERRGRVVLIVVVIHVHFMMYVLLQ